MMIASTTAMGDTNALNVSESEALKANRIQIKSDRLIFDNNSKYAEFIGNTETITQNATIIANKMKLFLKKNIAKNATPTNETISKIEFKGNVQITYQDKRAFADNALFDVEKNVFILNGEPAKIQSENNWFTGNKIIFNKENGQIIAEGNTKAVVNPNSKNKTDIKDD